ncbi:SH3 domain-containing protein [bacterium]|nr:SH3 domain-containing protein [bacterium]
MLVVLGSGAAMAQSGLPIPRFVSFKSEEVNVRTGPGTRYPVQWVYKSGGLPMEVVEEFEQWRKVKDVDGETGWVHQSMLSGKRRVMVKAEQAVLLRQPRDGAAPLVRAERGVIGDVIECQLQWCSVQISNIKGWARKDVLWGIYPEELIED